MENKIWNEDCLTGMLKIKDNSIDMILCDLPYDRTKNTWDELIYRQSGFVIIQIAWIAYQPRRFGIGQRHNSYSVS
ncbi:hypothetical protein LHM76_002716 [Listeria monocytogenes]|nr:hypothetical protein [Listeria monocytogenes]